MLGALHWLLSPAWDAVEITPKVGFICPFVVIDHTDLGETNVVAQVLCLTILNLPQHKSASLPMPDSNRLSKTPVTSHAQDQQQWAQSNSLPHNLQPSSLVHAQE